MRIFKILLNKFSVNQPKTQSSIASEIFDSMIKTCDTKREQATLYKLANSLPKDIYISSIDRNKNQLFFESPNMSIESLKKLMKSLTGTFVTYAQKNNPQNIIQRKISDKILLPPDKKTMKAIVDIFTRK